MKLERDIRGALKVDLNTYRDAIALRMLDRLKRLRGTPRGDVSG